MFNRWLQRSVERVLLHSVTKLQSQIGKLESRCQKMKDRLCDAKADIDALRSSVEKLVRDREKGRLLTGGVAARAVRQLPASTRLAEAEFRVFSQWGEDGIIQFLLAHVPVEHEIFVEFGVEDYSEANTRFLLEHNHWRGLVLDGSREAMEALASSDLAWRHHFTAMHSWITAENINDLITRDGISGDIGLLSVDVDGMDYWIWQAIDCISPRIVICEYNALFGATADVTIPSQPDFRRNAAHDSNLCYGASLASLSRLAREKGYRLAGVNTAGNNAFFVRGDLMTSLPERSVEEVFQPSRFRESRHQDGTLSYLRFKDAQEQISRCTVWDFKTSRERVLRDIAEWR